MNQPEKVDHAIHTLEAHRHLLGQAVVDTTIAALRDLLTGLTAGPTAITPARAEPVAPDSAQRKTVTVLFAHLVGSTQLTTPTKSHDMPTLANGLWQQLDEAIQQEGGLIDKHMGNTVMAVFGVPTAHENDPVRAVRAALTMQTAFEAFVAELNPAPGTSQPDNGSNGQVNSQPIQLRIGLNTGPVIVGQVGSNSEQTSLGDTVNVAYRLGQLADQSGIYLSHDTYSQIAALFEMELLPPLHIRGRPEPVTAYRVLGRKSRPFYQSGWRVEGVETALVGRDEALAHLRHLLAQPAVKGRGQMVTIVGEAGIGKSRLAYEFGQWAQQQPEELLVLRAKSDQGIRPLPFALARDLLASTLDIQDNEPAALVEEKLMIGLHQFNIDSQDLRRQARLLGQLVGLGVANEAGSIQAEGLGLKADTKTSLHLRDQAFAAWANLVQQAVSQSQTSLIFLEDLHVADRASMELLAHVSPLLAQAPVLLVCLARPSLYERWPHWPQLDDTISLALPHTRLDLEPLPPAASRQLVQNILHQIPQLPEALLTLVVEKAAGNPFYVEELLKTLIDDGLIITGAEGWRVQLSQLARLRIPPTLTGVLQARLDRLSTLERTTLQRAAVMGRTFWETAVTTMNELNSAAYAAEETRFALEALQKRELIFQRATSVFAGSNAYIFKHALLQQVTYESVLLRQRPLYHKQVADWLSAESGERIAEYAGTIATHYELAGEEVLAAGLYELAGRRAQDLSNLDVAIDNYRQTLALLTDKPRHALWLLRLQERLGKLLLRRLRLVEAAQIYMTMQYTAEMDGELALQAHAWLGLATIQREQADYMALLSAAQQAYQAARLVSADAEAANALLLESEAHIYLGQIELAQERARDALALSRQCSLLAEQALALGLLCQIGYSQAKTTLAARSRQQLEQLAAAPDADKNTHKLVAFCHLVLAGVYQAAAEWQPAQAALERALALYQELDYRPALAQTQAALGQLNLATGDAEAAVTHLHQAVSLAETIGDEYGRMRYQLHLAQARLSLNQVEEAQTILHWLLTRLGNYQLIVDWWGHMAAYELWVTFHLACQEPELALSAARQAYEVSQKRGRRRDEAIAWRLLAQALQALQPQITTVTIAEQRYDVTGCFTRSWQLLNMANPSVPGHRLRMSQTLQAWQRYEAERSPDSELVATFSEREKSLQEYAPWETVYLPRL